jgi:O-antigen/teichoic acid export membrane protein
MPFIMRTVMIYVMGAEYLGLNSLFTSVLHVLNMAELGVGSAMTYSMYEPISKDDTKKIDALMKLYRTYYRIIGGVVFAIGMMLIPFLPKLIKGNVPSDVNIYVLYLLNLLATVLSYWLFAYRNSILNAHQRGDISSKVYILTDTIKYVLQLFAIVLLHNYYYFVIAILLVQIMHNVICAIISCKMYPMYKPEGKLESSEKAAINKRIRDLFTSKLGMVIVNSADNIVISAFLGLQMLAIYQNYYYLISAIIGIMSIIYTSCLAGVGNSLITETTGKNFRDFKRLTFIICWIAGFCTVCFLCLFQPFMELWMGKDLMLEYSAVITFAIYFLIYEINTLFNMFKDAAGIWHSDRFRPLVTALSNLVMNLLLVNVWGIYGVLLSTVFSTLFVGMPWLLNNLFTTVFDKSLLKEYLLQLIKYVVTIAFGAFFTGLLCKFTVGMDLVPQIVVNLGLCIIIPNIIFGLLFCRTDEFKYCLSLVEKILLKKTKKI